MTTRLFCYVDETGQDTGGRLYIVVAVLTQEPREQLYKVLETAERESGKGKRKWHRNSTDKRDRYISKTLRVGAGEHVQVYYEVFEGQELSYELTTVHATANAISAYTRREQTTDYKATVIIDGLPRSMQGRVGKLLRSAGIKTKSVRGERDETNPGIRLADAVAGLLRQVYEGDKHFQGIKEELEATNRLEQLP